MRFSAPILRPPANDQPAFRRAVVAIPAKDEAERLSACLNALVKQTDASGRPLPRDAFGVVVFANNCNDDTALVARRAAAASPFPIRVVEARLPKGRAHAGGARRGAMDIAAEWLCEWGALDGVMLTTDADSRVTPTWISANLAAFENGADAVLGCIELDEEGAQLPAALHARGDLEGRYESLLTEISARLDPQAANPWPHHATISGASLGLTRSSYMRIGGLPLTPLGEDKALVALLRRCDARIRYAPEVTVITSGRIAGRAPGGVADTLRLRSEDPSALCDEALEPCAVAFKRALWRGRLRRLGVSDALGWRSALRVPLSAARRARRSQGFGEAWAAIEQASLALAVVRLRPSDLPGQIERATRLLRRLERLTPFENVQPIFQTADLPDDVQSIAETAYEEIGGLIAG